MTTIAYRDGRMAGDTLTLADGAGSIGFSKVRRVNGWLLGIAGSAGLGRLAMEEAEDLLSEDVPPTRFLDLTDICEGGTGEDGDAKETLQLLMVHPVHGVWCAELSSKGWLIATKNTGPDKYAAIGSGAMGALCAMHCGASAVRALVACRVHCHETDGDIDEVYFEHEAERYGRTAPPKEYA